MSQKILITGGSRGIGLAIAHRFATLGASITLLSQSRTRLEAALSTLPQSPTQTHTLIAGDVADPLLWEQIRRSHKDLDVLINAAGTTHHSLLLSTPSATLDSIVRTNLLGTMLACRAVGRGMVRRGKGCIVNISSVVALRKACVGSAGYAASKAGVIGLTRTLAVEMGPRGVRSNVIVPGYIETDMTAGMSAEARERALEGTPLGRFGTPEEVADVAVFLVGCGFVNGAEVVVDGGLGCT